MCSRNSVFSSSLFPSGHTALPHFPAPLAIEWSHMTEFYRGCRQKLYTWLPHLAPSFSQDPSQSLSSGVCGTCGGLSRALRIHNQWQSLVRSLGFWTPPSASSCISPSSSATSVPWTFVFIITCLNPCRQLRPKCMKGTEKVTRSTAKNRCEGARTETHVFQIFRIFILGIAVPMNGEYCQEFPHSFLPEKKSH